MGSGVWPLAMATRPASLSPRSLPLAGNRGGDLLSCEEEEVSGRPSQACPWHAQGVLPLCAAAWVQAPIERLVPVSCAGCPASTSGLSTWWSSTALGETWF